MVNLSIIGLLVLIFVPISQLYARIFWMHGSLDKWWLLIPVFWFPPLSLVPSLMIYFGSVADGPGGIDPYDYWMLIPIFVKMFAGFIVDNYMEESFFVSLLPFILQLAANTIPFYIRSYRLCNGVQMNLLTKSFMDGVIANGVADIAPVVLSYLPFVGIVFSIIEYIPLIGPLVEQVIWSICYAGTYIIIKMINGADLGAFCNIPNSGRMTDQIGAVVLFIISCLTSFL